eukprot:COSAG06_NODE_43290_length_373_cov_0.948905_1_plen_90_part_01
MPFGIGLLIDGGSVLLWHSFFLRKVCVLAAIVHPAGLAGAVNAERKASHSPGRAHHCWPHAGRANTALDQYSAPTSPYLPITVEQTFLIF